MTNLVFIDKHFRSDFFPLSLTKPFSELRMGIQTFKERWLSVSQTTCAGYITADYLSEKYPMPDNQVYTFIDPRYFPACDLVDEIDKIKAGQALCDSSIPIAFVGTMADFHAEKFEKVEYKNKNLLAIKKIWQLFQYNHTVLEDDYNRITKNRVSLQVSSTNNIINPERIFLEEGAKIEYATLNASTGSIYIGKNAEIMEGSLVRGAFALCEGAVLNMGAKIYGATTVGPYCKVAGEVNNSIFIGYANKAHDGFLGNSIIGEWCNLGAGTNNSNLKNNYKDVRLYSYNTNRFENTGLQFCGLIMGDHSKSAIGTRFNTGTVVGVSSNIFQNGFPRNFIPSYSWGGEGKYKMEDAIEVAEIVTKRRNVELTKRDKKILEYIYKNDKY